MDNADRTACGDSPVAIPAELYFAFDEWLAELLRRAAVDTGSTDRPAAILEAVHLHDAFLAGTLTAAQTAELAAGAAGSLEPRWPTDRAQCR
jgi:hypothetical protein